MIILHLINGEKAAIPGESYQDYVSQFQLGKLVLKGEHGEETHIKREAVAFPEIIPTAELKRREEEIKRRNAEAEAKEKAEVEASWATKEEEEQRERESAEKRVQEQAEYMRRHPVRTWLGAMKKRLS